MNLILNKPIKLKTMKKIITITIILIILFSIWLIPQHKSTIKLFKVELQIQSIPQKDTTIYVFAQDKYNAERIIDETYFEEDDTTSIKENFQIIVPINN